VDLDIQFYAVFLLNISRMLKLTDSKTVFVSDYKHADSKDINLC